MRNWLTVFVLYFCLMQSGFGQDFAEIDTTVASPEYEYWRPRYYDSIPAKDYWNGQSAQSFEDMVVRYHNKDFEYVESISDKLSFFDTLFDRFQRFLENLFPQRSYEFDRSVYNILGVIGGIVFLILMYKLFFSGKKVYVHLDEEEEEEEKIAFVERNLMQVNLSQYIQDALQKGNFAVAIRYQQLFNIQLLQEKGHIDWKHTKTNMELMEGVDNAALRKDFLDCAAIYDHIWFGDFAIAEADYQRYAQIFKQFQQRWG